MTGLPLYKGFLMMMAGIEVDHSCLEYLGRPRVLKGELAASYFSFALMMAFSLVISVSTHVILHHMTGQQLDGLSLDQETPRGIFSSAR